MARAWLHLRVSGTPSKWLMHWVKEIQGLSLDVSPHLCDVTGAELLAMGREDIKDLGIQRPGAVALLVKAIQKLCEEEAESSATFIEQSDYCFEKNP